MTRMTKAEEFAIAHAEEAMAGVSDQREALLRACRAFREAMPPRAELASERLPDYEAGGRAAKMVLLAGHNGLLTQRIEDIVVNAGRALVEKAVPSAKVRKARGLPDYEAAGRAADKVFNRLSRSRKTMTETELHIAMGKAGMLVAWTNG